MASNIVCEIEECGKPVLAKCLCRKHYMRMRRHGDPQALRRRPNTETCTIDGCSRPHQCGGFCAAHYWRHLNGRDMTAPLGRRNHGEKYIDQYGYVCFTGRGHPEANTETGRVHEHRAVMAEKLGRKLLPGENVHHKNGVRSDNRPDNLELWVTSQPAGQRPEDLVAWAREILALYGPLFPEPGSPPALRAVA